MRGQLTFDALDPTRSQALFDETQRYRYWLARIWDANQPIVNFIMLNPSTADQYQLDPTVTRCLHYARRWGFGSLIVTNIFAYRSTDPKALYTLADPVGTENDAYLRKAATQANLRVAAWGTHGSLRNRHEAVLGSLADLALTALGVTQGGFPKHPLYLRADAWPVPYPTTPTHGPDCSR